MFRGVQSIFCQDENPPGFVTLYLQYLSARVGNRSRLTRVFRTVTSLTLRDIASPRINCVRASASTSAVAISIAAAAAATTLRPSINCAELRPVGVFTYICACVRARMRAYVHVRIISLQSPTITLIKHEITEEK